MLILLNGVLSGAEIALVSLRPTRVEELVEEKRRGATAVAALRRQPERFLATIQVGITVIGASAGAFGGASLAEDVAPLFAAIPALAPHAQALAFVLVVGAISYLSLVLGELVPKSIALRSAEGYALLVARPLLALAWIARPIVWLLTKSSNLLLKPFGDSTNFSEARLSPGEIRQLVDEAATAGTVDAASGEIATRALDFADLTVSEVMVPRHRVVSIPEEASREEVQRIVLDRGKYRVPVVKDDEILGYVTARDLLSLFVVRRVFRLRDVMRPVFVVPDVMGAADLLTEMGSRQMRLAVVVDERGAMAGIVTLEDLVEELVGEIHDEHDAERKDEILLQEDGSVTVMGDVAVRDLNRELDLDLPIGETWSTVAGLVLELAGRIPQRGDTFALPDGSSLEVLDATPRRVERIRVRHPSAPPPPPPDG